MNFTKMMVAAAAMAATGNAMAAPSADEIKLLGTKLTHWGAEKAGNMEGTIPEYTGGVKNPPKVDYKAGVLPDPFPEDKVLFWIDAKNMDQYGDKVSPGLQVMIKKSPATMRVAVYPSRRSASYPQNVLDNTVKNATRCGLKESGNELDISKGCRGGFPFPIPKTGDEAMWNHFSAYLGPGRIRENNSYMVKGTGEVVLVNALWAYEDNQLYDPNTPAPVRHMGMKTEYFGPTRLVGNATVMIDAINNERKALSYTSASKRTRLAPDYAADMPIATTGGAMLYDQINLFSGTLERFDWKLVGKKEMYIPYNDYRRLDNPSKECTAAGGLFQANHLNPNCVRFELHRVWHLQGTVKAGKRHVLAKRDYYFDEDTWAGGMADGYDHAGKLYILQTTSFMPDYVKHAPMFNSGYNNFDLNSGTYHYSYGTRSWTLDKPMPQILNSDTVPVFTIKKPD